MNNKPSKRMGTSASDYAYMEIKEKIIKGHLKPNEDLNEEKLAEQLEISRTPLREALTKLEWEEFISRKRNGRMQVASISLKHMIEIFTVRNALECIVVEKATDYATPNDIKKLEHLVQLISFVSSKNNLDETLYYGNQFHTYLYELSDHQTAIKILLQLNDQINRYRRLIPAENMSDHKKLDHKKIFDFIKVGDKQGAIQAMDEHVKGSLESAMKVLKESQQTQEHYFEN